MNHSLVVQRMVALCLAGLALLNFPLLALWDGDLTLWGLPLLPLALFAIWALLIAGMAWLMERRGADAGPPPQAPQTKR